MIEPGTLGQLALGNATRFTEPLKSRTESNLVLLKHIPAPDTGTRRCLHRFCTTHCAEPTCPSVTLATINTCMVIPTCQHVNSLSGQSTPGAIVVGDNDTFADLC
jgi:hypothetical protein